MLDVSFTELALVVVVAFLILGPKELPTVIRALSRFLRQCREVIDECKTQLDGLGEEAGVNEIKSTLKGEQKFIQDQFGQWRETHDLSDIMTERDADAPVITSEAQQPERSGARRNQSSQPASPERLESVSGKGKQE